MVEAARGGFDQAVDFQAQAIFLAVNQKLALQLDWLRRLMQRYQQKQTSDQPWPDHHPFRNPRRIPSGFTLNNFIPEYLLNYKIRSHWNDRCALCLR